MKTERELLKEIRDAIDFADRGDIVDLWNYLFACQTQPKITEQDVQWDEVSTELKAL